MKYNNQLFEKLQNVAKLPLNRRKNDRRCSTRRAQNSLFKSEIEKRINSSRRLKDRRSITLNSIVNNKVSNVSKGLLDFYDIISIFSNVEITKIQSTNPHTFYLGLNIKFSDGNLFTQLEIKIDKAGRYLRIRQVSGDLLQFAANIEISPFLGNKTKLITSIFIDPGLHSFEAFMGDVFKNKFRMLFRNVLDRVSIHLGGMEKEPCDFGFLVHTIPDYFSITFSDSSYATIPDSLFKYLLQSLPPFKCSYITGAESPNGKKIFGNLIYSPLAPSHFLSLDKKTLLNQMIEAGNIAKDLGAKILGLGAYTAFVGKRGKEIQDALGMPVTTGTSYTIAMALKALEVAAEKSGKNLQDLTLTVIGATGSIGKVCSEIMADKVGKVVLVARNERKLQQLGDSLRMKNKAEVEISTDLKKSIKYSDLVLISTNTPGSILDINDISSGTIICDISQPRNITPDQAARRNDILVLDGGVVEPPGKTNFNFYFGLPPGLAYGCIAETMILAFEERFESFSIGGNITTDKVREIELMGERNGFRLAELKSFGQFIDPGKFELIKSF